MAVTSSENSGGTLRLKPVYVLSYEPQKFGKKFVQEWG